MRNNKKSLTPLLVTGAIVIVPLIFVAGFIIGNQVQIKVSLGNTDSIGTWVSAIATVMIALLTFVLAKETWYLREAQTKQLAELKSENIRPNMNIQLESSVAGVNLINVKISNLGKGIARKVSFEFLNRDGNQIQENEHEYVVVKKFQKLAIFRLGIESVGINQVISSYIFNFVELRNEVEGEIFKLCLNVIIKFEDVEGIKYTNTFVMDFAQFEGITKIGSDSLHQISKDIQKIREYIGNVTGNNRRIGVDVFNSVDRRDEEEQLKEFYEECSK